MANKKLIEKHNRNYLINVISKGTLNQDSGEFWFRALDNKGRHDGYLYIANMSNGQITRYKNGNGYTFGVKENSESIRGYMNIEMVVPYDAIIFKGINKSNLYMDSSKAPVGVQYTCYIQKIIEYINCRLKNIQPGTVANHMNGCKCDNSSNNIESVSELLNITHGAVFNSMIIKREQLEHRNNINDTNYTFGIKTISNNKYDFEALENGIEAHWVIEYSRENELFSRQLNRCIKTTLDGTDRKYISADCLIQFICWLYKHKLWVKSDEGITTSYSESTDIKIIMETTQKNIKTGRTATLMTEMGANILGGC